MNAIKLQRLNNQFLTALSEILTFEVKNPILKSVCVTSVSITSDLSFAKVYFTCMDIDQKLVLKELKDAQGFLRSMVCEKIEIRHTPELEFHYDESIEYGQKIEAAIKKIHENED